MARCLIVGCGCHGRQLAAELIARGDHQTSISRELVDGRNDRITIGNGQRSARAEIVLDVDHDQRVHGR